MTQTAIPRLSLGEPVTAEQFAAAMTAGYTELERLASHHGWCGGWRQYAARLTPAYQDVYGVSSVRPVTFQWPVPPEDLTEQARARYAGLENDFYRQELATFRRRGLGMVAQNRLSLADANRVLVAMGLPSYETPDAGCAYNAYPAGFVLDVPADYDDTAVKAAIQGAYQAWLSALPEGFTAYSGNAEKIAGRSVQLEARNAPVVAPADCDQV
jgi:hypothetical protein